MEKKLSLEELKDTANELAYRREWGEAAIKLNKQIIELDKTYSYAYTRLAKCYILNGDKVKAIKLYEQVLQFDEKNLIANNGIERLDYGLRIVSNEIKNKLNTTKLKKRNNYGIYVNHCHSCKREVNSHMERCDECGWYICEKCGACGCNFRGYR